MGHGEPNMMGRTHALTGIAGGIGVTYLYVFSVPIAVTGIFITMGAALLPDIDHPRATVSNTFGPLSKGLSWIMRKLTGGHRRGTHSIFGILILGAIAQYGVMNRHVVYGVVPLCIIMILCAAGAIRLLKIPGWVDDMAPVPGVLGIVCLTDVPLDIVPLAVMLGCAIHVLGDVVTLSGCPIWWPFSDDRVKLALFKTNGKVERYLVTPVVIISIVAGILCKMVDITS